MTRPLDLVIKNVRVVRPNRSSVDLLDIGIKDGKFARLAPDIRPEEANEVVDGKNRLAFPGLVDAHMHVGIYRPLAEDAVEREQGRGDGRGDLEPHVYPHGPVLPQPRRPLSRVHAGAAQARAGELLGRLRLPRRADRIAAHRRDGLAPDRLGRAVVQDLHVLRRLRPARQVGQPEPVPDDRAGRALRHRALRVHHAFGAPDDGAASGARATRSASACTASSPRS